MESVRVAAALIVTACLVWASRGAHAEGFVSCRKAVAQQRFLPLLAWIDGRQYPFVVKDASWKEDALGASEVVYSKPRKGTVADISDEAKEALLWFEGCLAVDSRNFLLTDESNGTNFNGLYHFDVTRSSFREARDTDKRLAPGHIELVAEADVGRSSRILVIRHDFTNRAGNYSGYAVFHAGPRRPKQGPAFYELLTVTDNRECCGRVEGEPVRQPEGEVVIWVENDRKRTIEVKDENELDIRFLGIRQDGSETPSIEFDLPRPSGIERLSFRMGAGDRFVLQK